MIKRKGKFIAFALAGVMICIMSFAGCSGAQSKEDKSSSAADSVQQSSSQELSSSEENDKLAYEISLTYANSKYIETGDESLPKVIRDGSATVTVDKSAAADEDEGLAFAAKSAIELLKDDPSQHGGASDDATYVSDVFGVGDVTVKDGICTIDLTGDELMNQNMYTEKYFILQTVDTILNSLSEISAVQFTVNGEAADALSYMSIDGQFTRDTINEMTDPS